MENADLIKSLIKAKGEFKPVQKTSENPFFKSKYADLSECIDATEPALLKHGLAVIQFPVNDGDKVGIETMLLHESGQSITNRFTGSPIKNDPQAVGSLITYYRRYSYMAVLGLAPEDDDGNQASKQSDKKPTTPPAKSTDIDQKTVDQYIKELSDLLVSSVGDVRIIQSEYNKMSNSLRESKTAYSAGTYTAIKNLLIAFRDKHKLEVAK